MSSAIATLGLAKKFGRFAAVDGIDLSVPQGSIYGFLGPNGSGKTTTIRMLLGLIAASDGIIEVLGERMPRAGAQVLPRVGALVEGPAFYPYLTGAANLARLCAIDATSDPATAQRRAADALDRVGLTAAARKKYRHYSLGMKQRLGLAAALLQRRDLLILDEPMNGLDPQGTREIRTLMRQLNADGVTILVSSHLLSEVEQVCSDIGIMSRGRLVRQDSLAALRDQSGAVATVRTTESTHFTARGVLETMGLTPTLTADGCWSIALADTAPQAVTAALVSGGVELTEFTVAHESLEEMFVELTGAGFGVAG